MKRTMKTMLAAGAALATTLPSLAGIQLNDVYSEASLTYENGGGMFGDDEYEYDSDTADYLGTARAEAGNDPGGAAWSSTFRYQGGTRFEVRQGLSYDSMWADPADFRSSMYSRLSITIDRELQLDYSFNWSLDSAELRNGSFTILRGSTYVDRRTYSSSNQAAGSSIMLDPGAYTFIFRLGGREGSNWMEYSSSSSSQFVANMNFSEVPAPGGLALLGLAGCAWRRARRE